MAVRADRTADVAIEAFTTVSGVRLDYAIGASSKLHRRGEGGRRPGEGLHTDSEVPLRARAGIGILAALVTPPAAAGTVAGDSTPILMIVVPGVISFAAGKTW